MDTTTWSNNKTEADRTFDRLSKEKMEVLRRRLHLFESIDSVDSDTSSSALPATSQGVVDGPSPAGVRASSVDTAHQPPMQASVEVVEEVAEFAATSGAVPSSGTSNERAGSVGGQSSATLPSQQRSSADSAGSPTFGGSTAALRSTVTTKLEGLFSPPVQQQQQPQRWRPAPAIPRGDAEDLAPTATAAAQGGGSQHKTWSFTAAAHSNPRAESSVDSGHFNATTGTRGEFIVHSVPAASHFLPQTVDTDDELESVDAADEAVDVEGNALGRGARVEVVYHPGPRAFSGLADAYDEEDEEEDEEDDLEYDAGEEEEEEEEEDPARVSAEETAFLRQFATSDEVSTVKAPTESRPLPPVVSPVLPSAVSSPAPASPSRPPPSLPSAATEEEYMELLRAARVADSLLSTQSIVGQHLFSDVHDWEAAVGATRQARSNILQDEALLASRQEETKMQVDDVVRKSTELCAALQDLVDARTDPRYAAFVAREGRIEDRRAEADALMAKLQQDVMLIDRRRAHLNEMEAHNDARARAVQQRREHLRSIEAQNRTQREKVSAAESEVRTLEERAQRWTDILNRREEALAAREARLREAQMAASAAAAAQERYPTTTASGASKRAPAVYASSNPAATESLTSAGSYRRVFASAHLKEEISFGEDSEFGLGR